jgi:hypothetical protein
MGLSRNLSLLLGGGTACTYMVASFIPLWVRCMVAVTPRARQLGNLSVPSGADRRSLRTAYAPDDFGNRAVALLCYRRNLIVHGHTICSIWRHGNGFYFPSLPWNRVLANRAYSYHGITSLLVRVLMKLHSRGFIQQRCAFSF